MHLDGIHPMCWHVARQSPRLLDALHAASSSACATISRKKGRAEAPP